MMPRFEEELRILAHKSETTKPPRLVLVLVESAWRRLTLAPGLPFATQTWKGGVGSEEPTEALRQIPQHPESDRWGASFLDRTSVEQYQEACGKREKQ